MTEQVSLSDIAQLELREGTQQDPSHYTQADRPEPTAGVGDTVLAGVNNNEFILGDDDTTSKNSAAKLDDGNNSSSDANGPQLLSGKSNTTSGLPTTGIPDSVDTATINPSQLQTSTIAENVCQVFSVFFALVVRAALAIFCLVSVYLVVHHKDDARYWALAALLIFLLIETINIVVKRKGHERKWISMCFVCYLIAGLPSIWILRLRTVGRNETECSGGDGNIKVNSDFINSDQLTDNLENCFVFLIILCRWILPRGEITHDQLSQLLFVFIGMGSDTTELFQLYSYTDVANDRVLRYFILAIWSLSLFQFTLVLTMSASPKKARIAMDVRPHVDDGDSYPTNQRGMRSRASATHAGGRSMNMCQLFFAGTEVWSLIVTITMQDGPYFAVRLYVAITYNIANSNILFFMLKNGLVIIFLLYRLVVVALTLSEAKEREVTSGNFLGDDGHMTLGGTSTLTDVSTLASRSSAQTEKYP